MLRVFPRLAMKDGQFRRRADSLLLKSGEPLENVSEFLEVMRRIGYTDYTVVSRKARSDGNESMQYSFKEARSGLVIRSFFLIMLSAEK
jgi:hypothetical protein